MTEPPLPGPNTTALIKRAAASLLAPPARQEALAGIVRVELPEGALPWKDTMDEQVLRLRGQYTAGVEYLAGTYGAYQPIAWEDDSLTLVFTERAVDDLPSHTYKAAKELWNRIRTELDLPIKIAAHVGRVGDGTEPGTFTGADIDDCKRLAAGSPPGYLTLTEDLALALPDDMRREAAVLGSQTDDERLLYIFPRSASPTAESGFTSGESARLWGRLRGYATGPDVRLVRYVGFRLQRKHPPMLDIRDIFVPSEMELRRRADVEMKRQSALEAEGMVPPWSALEAAKAQEGVLAFREIFAKHRSVIVLGDPGSGKTTLLRWLAVIAGSGRFALDAQLGVAERLLPLPVSVGRLAEIRRGFGAEGISVIAALARYFRDRSVDDDEATLRSFLGRTLEKGRCLILLDGLDEVKSDERRAIHAWIESFAAEYPENRFIASSRVVGYAGFQLPGETAEAVLRPFTDAQVERYVHAFHRAYVRFETGAEPATPADADRLLEALRASPRLSALGKNPFMLSALALIHRAEGRLPRHRVQAYELFARALCETWGEARRIVAGEAHDPTIAYEEEALPILGDLALAMHEQYPTGVAPEEFVIDKLAHLLSQQRNISGKDSRRAAKEFLKRAGEDVQILLERGANAWGFLHLTFQEFFVAAGLHAAERFDEIAFQHLFDPRWEEVLRLGVGYLALIQKRPKAAQRFVEKVLVHQEPEPRSWLTRVIRKQVPLAALLAAEAGDALPAGLQERIAAEMAEWLKVMPKQVSRPILADLALTDFAARVVTACQMLLQSTMDDVRARGVWALGELRSTEAGDIVLGMLSDLNDQIRAAAVTALRGMPAGWLVEKAMLALANPQAEVRVGIIEAIAPLGRKIPDEIMRSALGDAHELVRSKSSLLLKHRPRNEAVAALQLLARDPSATVRTGAVSSMFDFKMADELAILLKDGDANVRRRAIAPLAIMNPSLIAADIDSISDDRAIKISLVDALSPPPPGTDPIKFQAQRLRRSEPFPQLLAAMALIGSKDGLDILIEAVQDPSPAVRKVALRMLQATPSNSLPHTALAALQDSDAEVRTLAACVVAKHKRAEALAPLLDELQAKTGPWRNISSALVELGSREAAEPLITAAEDNDADAVSALSDAIGHLASSQYAARLEKLLQRYPTPCVAAESILGALWTIADREARRPPDPAA